METATRTDDVYGFAGIGHERDSEAAVTENRYLECSTEDKIHSDCLEANLIRNSYAILSGLDIEKRFKLRSVEYCVLVLLKVMIRNHPDQ